MIPLLDEDPFQKVTAGERAVINRCKRAYELFRLGWDTLKISKLMNTTEAKAEMYVTAGRCRARGLPNPYDGVE